MRIFRVPMGAQTSYSVAVKAETPEEAIQKAKELEGVTGPTLCWQCSHHYDDMNLKPLEWVTAQDVDEIKEGEEGYKSALEESEEWE